MLAKRIIIATILGAICGIVCWQLASRSSEEAFALSLTLTIILGRTLIGFGIGISAWKMKWWLHGIIMGIIFSIPSAFGAMMNQEKAFFIFIGTIVMGIIYGFFIELITSVIFKAKQA